MFILVYVGDIMFAYSAEELQHSLNILLNYCNIWKYLKT